MTLTALKTALNAFWSRLTADLRFMWQEDRVFLFIFAILILLAKGSSLAIKFLAFRSKQEVSAATKESNVLQAQENAYDQQADVLVQQSKDLPGQEKTVGPNWDKSNGDK